MLSFHAIVQTSVSLDPATYIVLAETQNLFKSCSLLLIGHSFAFLNPSRPVLTPLTLYVSTFLIPPLVVINVTLVGYLLFITLFTLAELNRLPV